MVVLLLLKATSSPSEVAIYTVRVFARNAQNRNAADVVKKTYIDENELAVDQHGKMAVKATSTPKDESATNRVRGF